MYNPITVLDFILKPFLILIVVGFAIMIVGASMKIFEIAYAYETFKTGVGILGVVVLLFLLTMIIDALISD